MFYSRYECVCIIFSSNHILSSSIWSSCWNLCVVFSFKFNLVDFRQVHTKYMHSFDESPVDGEYFFCYIFACVWMYVCFSVQFYYLAWFVCNLYVVYLIDIVASFGFGFGLVSVSVVLVYLCIYCKTESIFDRKCLLNQMLLWLNQLSVFDRVSLFAEFSSN